MAVKPKRPFKGILSAIIASLVSACTTTLFQDGDKALVGRGEEKRQFYTAKDFAAYYLPYAVLSDIAYQNLPHPAFSKSNPARALEAGPDPKILPEAYFGGEAGTEGYWRKGQTHTASGSLVDWARRILANWTFIGAYQVDDETPQAEICSGRPGPRTEAGCLVFKGLEVQAWGSIDPTAPHELAIVFRGTDADSFGDWMTNLRWLTSHIPAAYDQYDQVRDNIGSWIDWSKDRYAKILRQSAKDPTTADTIEIVAVGHSLGGGLAQHAAYSSNGAIKRVVTFDPSPVTGYYSVPEPVRTASEAGMTIDRVYEHGEVLAFVRLFMRELYPIDGHDPAIYQVRFNKAHGDIISQHSMHGLISSYMALVGDTAIVRADRPKQLK